MPDAPKCIPRGHRYIFLQSSAYKVEGDTRFDASSQPSLGRPSPVIMEEPQGEDSAVQDFLQILEEHRKNCERQGKYVEAEIAKNRLEELKVLLLLIVPFLESPSSSTHLCFLCRLPLKLHEENRRKEAMRSRQIAERLGVEEAHMLEFQQFNIVWDKKTAEYERNAEDLIKNMKVKESPQTPSCHNVCGGSLLNTVLCGLSACGAHTRRDTSVSSRISSSGCSPTKRSQSSPRTSSTFGECRTRWPRRKSKSHSPLPPRAIQRSKSAFSSRCLLLLSLLSQVRRGSQDQIKG